MPNKSKNKSGKLKTITGVIRISAKPTGYINPEEGLAKRSKDPVLIPEEKLNTALDGDTVEVTYGKQKNQDGGPLGEVLRIVKRAKIRFVGTTIKDGDKMVVQGDNPKLYRPIVLKNLDKTMVEPGVKVFAEITKWEDSKDNPEGKIIEIIGTPGNHEVEMQAIMLDKGFVFNFPPVVEKEAEEIQSNFPATFKKELGVRRDMRDRLTMTIDPESAKDFDDALSFKDLGNNTYEIGIHIADVAFFVRPGTELDREASERATSVYMVDRTIPMLPEGLSNDICSLVPNQDRLTFSAVFNITTDGKITDEWYGRTAIHSDKRFSYEGAQEALDNPQAKFHKELTALNKVAKALNEKKIAGGAILFADSEVGFELDEDGRPIRIYPKVRTDTHLMIEDFMLLANRKVAEFVHKKTDGKENTFVYRIHDAPDTEKIADLAAFLKPLGYSLSVDDSKPITSAEINKMLERADDKPEEFMVQQATIRSMAKAVYATSNIGHFGLAFEHYTHFTSPIRRYPDLLVHRLLDFYLKNERPSKEILAGISHEVIHSSQMEVKASEAERESIKFKQTEYMQQHIGKVFDGIVSGVAKFGIFIEETTTKTNGMVRLGTLKEYYEYDEKKYALISKQSGKKIRLGDKVRIKVTGADPLKKIVDFEIVS